MSKALWCIYENDMPKEYFDFLNSEEMKRLRNVGMHCGLEYTSFPFYKDLDLYSRYDHSLGVALIVYHFIHDLKMSLAGLFHDISTPCFAHVIDFLEGDHEKQEKTEEKTTSILAGSAKIQEGLKKYGLKTSDVDDYHLYPIADNDSPRLSADRLEYTLNNLYNYHFATLPQIKAYYDDLTVTRNEDGEEELSFRHEDKALEFCLLTLKNSEIYVRDEDRYSMEYLARMLKEMISLGILSKDDLYTTEPELITKLNSSQEGKVAWERYTSLHRVKKEETPSSCLSYMIPSKKRYIDPLVYGKGRLTSINEKAASKVEAFKKQPFDFYLVNVD